MREQRALFSGVLSPNLPSGICVLWMIILVLSEFCLSFNIDVSRPLVFQGTADTNFGAALDLLNNSDGKWWVIYTPHIMFRTIYIINVIVYSFSLSLSQNQ